MSLIERNNAVIRMLKEQNRLFFELKYSEKYGNLNKQKEFWLGGKTKQEIKDLFNQYVIDYSLAFGHKPAWLSPHGDDYKISKFDIERVNLNSFKIIMRQEWEK